MRKFLWLCCTVVVASVSAVAQTPSPMTWDQVRLRFEPNNPTLIAGQLNIDESKAMEITAFLRPNPQFTFATDGTQLAPGKGGPWQPLRGNQQQWVFSYLHERQHKRELRLESAQKGTAISVSAQADLERNLLFAIRSAFVQTLQAKAVLVVAKENLDYYDHVLAISSDRYKAGDLAQVDLARLELQRVQYESDVESAEVNLRVSKIQLLMLMDERTPVEQFDVTGPFDFADQLQPLEEFRRIALDTRPDLRAALEAIDKAVTDHNLAVSNGSTDPTFSGWLTRNPSFNWNTTGLPVNRYTLGLSVSVPLRVFDRNQGEKLRTQIDIDRNKKLTDAAKAQVFSDVDSAHALVSSNLNLLRPYKAKYLQQAVWVRETVTFSYQHGGASLLDFLNAENDYRSVQLNYVNLVGSYLLATSQLNLAVGREVIQ